jgi:pimeloyl-ACP methyl ester carboxylesterase
MVGDSGLNQRVTTTAPAAWLERLVDKSRPDFQAIEAEARKADPEALRLSAEALSSIDWRPELAKLQTPAVVVHGEQDPLVQVPDDSVFDGLNSNVHRVLLNDSRHFPMFDEANSFNRLLADFLSAQDVSQLQLKKHWVRRVR